MTAVYYYTDLFLLNQIMSIEQNYTTVAFIHHMIDSNELC